MRTLLIDIETSPSLGWVWSLWNQNVGLNQLVLSGDMLCFAAEWYDRPYGKQFHAVWQDGGREAMVAAAWNLLDEADVLVHYNGRRFDVPHLNAAFYAAGLTPPSPFKQVDLLSTVRKQFKIPSRKLAYVTEWSGLPSKISTGGFELWTGVMAGDEKAQRKMERYNRNDVSIMRPLYKRLLPWTSSPPNANLYGAHGCPRCSAPNSLQSRGTRKTAVAEYDRYVCTACGGWSTGTRRINGTSVRAEN